MSAETARAVRTLVASWLPPVVVTKEADLMSVVAHPKFPENNRVYLSFCDTGERDTAMTKIVRAQLRGWQLEEKETIFEIPRENLAAPAPRSDCGRDARGPRNAGFS